jgi:hypothetical protein
MRSLEGIVLVVQEGRFTVRADQGESHLFVLSSHAPLEPAQLAGLAQARVRVRYRPAPDQIALEAHAVDVIGRAAA